jgi:vacuolar-type H+-ATPase subunit H
LTQTVEETLKALTEFEADLDKIKSQASAAKQKIFKMVEADALAARASAMESAQSLAKERLESARQAAETEADALRKRGEHSLKKFKDKITKKKDDAVEEVLRQLLTD